MIKEGNIRYNPQLSIWITWGASGLVLILSLSLARMRSKDT